MERGEEEEEEEEEVEEIEKSVEEIEEVVEVEGRVEPKGEKVEGRVGEVETCGVEGGTCKLEGYEKG